MTLSDLEWPFHGSSVPSVWEGRANVNPSFKMRLYSQLYL